MRMHIEPSAPSMSSAVASVAAAAKRRAGRVTRNSHDGLSSLGLPLNTDDSDGTGTHGQTCIPSFLPVLCCCVDMNCA